MSYIAQLRFERIYGDTWHSSDTLSSFMPIFAARIEENTEFFKAYADRLMLENLERGIVTADDLEKSAKQLQDWRTKREAELSQDLAKVDARTVEYQKVLKAIALKEAK